MNKELILVLDFGGQYNQLIARRVRECNVYCEVHPYNMSLDKIKEMNPHAVIYEGDWRMLSEESIWRILQEHSHEGKQPEETEIFMNLTDRGIRKKRRIQWQR